MSEVHLRSVPGDDASRASARNLTEGIFDLGYGRASDPELAWQRDALCAQTDPDLFFPEKGGSSLPAASICQSCPVRVDCLEYALAHDIRHGVWGGLSDNERRRVSRERRRAQGA